jgi:hypothetical protein
MNNPPAVENKTGCCRFVGVLTAKIGPGYGEFVVTGAKSLNPLETLPLPAVIFQQGDYFV